MPLCELKTKIGHPVSSLVQLNLKVFAYRFVLITQLAHRMPQESLVTEEAF